MYVPSAGSEGQHQAAEVLPFDEVLVEVAFHPTAPSRVLTRQHQIYQPGIELCDRAQLQSEQCTENSFGVHFGASREHEHRLRQRLVDAFICQ